MQNNLERIASRIIICDARSIADIFENQPIGAVFSISTPFDTKRGWPDFNFTQTIHAVSCLHNLPLDIAQADKPIFEREAVKVDLELAKRLLEDTDDEKIIFHCLAGVHKSPAFVFMLLNSLQGKKPDLDLSIKILHKIRPQCQPSGRLIKYKSYLGKDFETHLAALRDYERIKKIKLLPPHSDLARVFSNNLRGTQSHGAVPRDIKAQHRRFGL